MNWDASLHGVWRQSAQIGGRLFLSVRGLSSPLTIALLVVGLAALAVSVYLALTRAAALRARDRELAATKQTLASREADLASAQQQLAQMQQGSAPLLQVIHELRSPAAAIQSTLDVLLQGYTASNEAVRDEMLRLARDRAEMMLVLVNDLLTLGTTQQNVTEPGQATESSVATQPVQLADMLWEVMPQMRIKATLRGVHLDATAPESLPLIRASEEHIRQLLSNLIDNAIKYTHPEGSVTVALWEDGGRVHGKVADTGIGISEEDRARVFDQFYRADNAKEVEAYGTGLGLSVVSQVVGLYDGELHLDSELGKGSTFAFSFPVSQGTASAAGSHPRNAGAEHWAFTATEKEAIT